MSILHSAARRLSTLVATCALLGAAAPAPAAVIAIFDPAFGPTVPNLGFRGSITLDVAPACYLLGSGFFFTGGACTITASNAQVDFYNASTDPSNVLTSVFLDASYFAPDYVFGAYFDPLTGQLAGFDTNDSVPFSFSVTDNDANFPVNYQGSMVLYFVSGEDTQQDGLPGVGGAYLRNCVRGDGDCVGPSSNPGALTFTTVPEPDSIALAALGLGALLVSRRRKPGAH